MLRRMSRYLPDRIERRTINPLDDRHGTIAALRSLRFSAANTFHFFFDFPQRTDRKLRSFDRTQKILTLRVDGNAAFGHDHIDQFAWPAKRRHLVDDHRNAVAEGRHSQDRASRRKAVLPSANAMKKSSVGVRDHIGVEVRVTSVAPSTTASTIDAK